MTDSADSAVDISQLHVAVLAGGPGSERAVSLNSAKGVVGALTGRVGKVTLVDVTGPDFVIPGGNDLAFNVIHGTYGEDGELQAELRLTDSRRADDDGHRAGQQTAPQHLVETRDSC